MKRLFGVLLSASFLFGESPLFMQTRYVEIEQNLQRKHLEQIHYPSLSSWRAWGIVHTKIKKTFIGEQDDCMGVMPQIGVDKEFSLIGSKIFLGVDVSAEMLNSSNPQGSLENYGFGLGGYMLWKWDNDIFASFSMRYAHFFQTYHSQPFSNATWLFDLGVGKRFALPNEYFLQTEFNFGTGILLDSEAVVNGRNEVMKPWAPFSFLGSVSVGKMLGKHQVQTKVKMLYDVGAGGELMVDDIVTLITPKQKFDMFIGIDYNAQLLEGSSFYIYADFSALNLDVNLGVGIKVEFGFKQSDLMSYPARSLKKLPTTDLQ